MSDWILCTCTMPERPITGCACGGLCNVQIGDWRFTVHLDGEHWNIECAKKEVASRM